MAEWFETLDAETLAHATAKGWNVPDAAAAAAAAVKAHHGAEKLIGHPADQVLKLPKDAADPSYQSVYDRVVGMSTPKDPAEYKFDGVKFKDGTDLAEEDRTFVRKMATKYKLPTTVAAGIAADLAARADAAYRGARGAAGAARAVAIEKRLMLDVQRAPTGWSALVFA